MATIRQLIDMLPPTIYFNGLPYYLIFKQSKVDARCSVIGYVDGYTDNYLVLGTDWFYVETERHYATYTMLQILLYYADVVLKETWYLDSKKYNDMIDRMFDDSQYLMEYCEKYQNMAL